MRRNPPYAALREGDYVALNMREGSDFRQRDGRASRIVDGMTTQTQTFAVRPIGPAVADQLRILDDAGRVPETVVDAHGGSPLRCCLRVSRPGERLLLASYAPLRRWALAAGVDPAAYDEQGPVFLHADACSGTSDDGWPSELRGTPRVLRAYGANGRIVDGRVLTENDDPRPAVAELFADDRVAFVHARALLFGCFTFAIQRA